MVWRHKFVCLAHRDQDCIPTMDAEKEELYQAGLWEEIEFESFINGSQIKVSLYWSDVRP